MRKSLTSIREHGLGERL